MNNETYVWNELSYRRYSNRKDERELDVFELEEIRNSDNGDLFTESYGLYEDIYKENTFGVDELFYFDKEC